MNDEMIPMSIFLDTQIKLQALKDLIKGEWVDKDLLCSAMCISGSEAMQMFEYGRMSVWNPRPLNGQRVIEKFRISEKTIRPAKAFWSDAFVPAEVVAEVNPDNHQWELVLRHPENS